MKLLRVSEAARRLGLSRPTIYEAVKRGQIRTVTISKTLFIPESEVERILQPGPGDLEAQAQVG